MNGEILLHIDAVTKTFPGVTALDSVSFDVKRGEIHALVGENGAGKSTLIKILAGIYTSYSGEITFDGKKIAFKNPSDAQSLGVSVVHQEQKLCEPLSVTENIFLGNLLYDHGLVDWKGMNKRAGELLKEMNSDIAPECLVESLSVAQKQIVEICKAINRDCKLLIMDEPSAILTDKELAVLFSNMKNLTARGVTIIFISHRLDEIFNMADTVTVLRDGHIVKTLPVKECTRDSLISYMVGRSMSNEYPKRQVNIGEAVLEAKGLSQSGVFQDISFTLHKGEILGFSGLVGAGRTEIVMALLGVTQLTSGEIVLNGEKIRPSSFRNSVKAGFALIPEDRKHQGLVQIDTVSENICMSSLKKVLSFGLIDSRKEAAYADEYVEKMRIATPNTATEVQYLSGGNQQKVVIAKWLMADSDIIIMDEPTRGIDVGAKSEIYNLMCDLIAQGKSIIMISSEMPELLGMSDNIVVIHEGKKVGELSRGEASAEKILAMCS